VNDDDFLLDVWAVRDDGTKVYPYKGRKGPKKGRFSVNFTSDTKRYQAMTAAELIESIKAGKFCQRGSVRMLPLDAAPGADCNAFAPEYFLGKRIRDTYCGS